MARRVGAMGLLAILMGLATVGPAAAGATVSCPYSGKKVQVIITNSKDGPRSCNAECVWRYGNVAYKGAGGAMLETGEAKTAYNSIAPYPIQGVVTSDINCNR